MLNPLLLLPYSPNEMTRKPGGGSTSTPLVPVDSELRERLSSQLLAVAEVAVAKRANSMDPIPVKVQLRTRALAKSNRPYAMLTSNALPPIAAGHAGELIVGATADRLKNLASTIRTAASKADQFFISTFESFSAWDVASDVFGLDSLEAASEFLSEIRERDQFLKVTFFPWTAQVLQRAVSPQAAISGASNPSQDVAQTYSEILGIRIRSANVSLHRPVMYISAEDIPGVEAFERIRGIRSVSQAPVYSSGAISADPSGYRPVGPANVGSFRAPSPSRPTVGVLDSGVNAGILSSSVIGVSNHIPIGRLDPAHGTFVAGLVIAPDQFNASGLGYPDDQANVFDGRVMQASGVAEPILFERILGCLDDAPRDVKVWNCSFGAPAGGVSYGSFAQDLDALSDERGVLFVAAAGNTAPGNRPWPPTRGTAYADELDSPSEAIRSLTVGARSQLGGFVPVHAPSSYSRRGPNFAEQVKPDLAHWGGDVDAAGVLSGFGTRSVLPGNIVAEGIGTSFAAPLASVIAANVWGELLTSAATDPTPELVKGLLAHSAFVNSYSGAGEHRDERYRHYYGWGTPAASARVLGVEDSEFTTVHEVVLTPGNDWFKRPFPVPASLVTPDGRFRGEVFVTVSYAPPINAAFGDEAVRYDVAGAFGAFRIGADGKPHFSGITPQQKVWGPRWEQNQIADGKWAPLKTYYHRAPIGAKAGEWALRLSLTERISEEIQREQRVYAVVTFKAIDPGVNIYNEGVNEIDRLRYANRSMVSSSRLRIDKPLS